MIDGYNASILAQAKLEEREQSLAREARLLSDILPDDYDVWVKSVGGNWQPRRSGGFLRSLHRGITFVAAKLTRRPAMPLDRPLTEQRRSGVSG